MIKYIDFLEKYKWYIVLLIPIFIIFFSFNLKHMSIDGSFRIWFKDNSTKLAKYDRFKNEFDSNEVVLIAFQDAKTIFDPKPLQSIKNISKKLYDLEYVEDVSSLLNYQYIHLSKFDNNSIEIDDFISDINTLTEKELREKKNIALNEKNLVNLFISEDAKSTMIIVKVNTHNKNLKVIDDINRILSFESERSKYKYWVNGDIAIKSAMESIAEKESSIYTPMAFLLSIILLFTLFRQVHATIIPIVIIVLTILLVLSLQLVMGYKLNPFTLNIPIFIVAIGIADTVHVYMSWSAYRRKGYGNRYSVLLTTISVVKPISYTSLTTIIGFGALCISNIIPIVTLGIAISSAIVIIFVLSVLWLPALLLLVGDRLSIQNYGQNYFKWNYGKFIVRYYKSIIIISIVSTIVMGIGIFNISINTDQMKYFSQKTEIRKSTSFIVDNITGVSSYELVVDSGREDGIKNPKFLNKVDEFYKYFFKNFPHELRNIKSIKDIIEKLNYILNYKNKIPNNHNLIAQYLLLYSMSTSEPEDMNNFINYNYQKIRIHISVNSLSSKEHLKIVNLMQKWWDNTIYTCTITGKTKLIASLQNDITYTLLYSLLITLILISLVMMFIFKDIQILWIFSLPNILPIFLALGVMGWLGIDINVGVAITVSIIIGISVNDTIHFLFKYFDTIEKEKNPTKVFNSIYSVVGVSIIFTSVILSLSFAIIIFSDFIPNRNFGIISSISIVFALILDLFLLPSLLLVFHNELDRDE